MSKSSSQPYLVKTKNLTKYYGNITAVDGLEFTSFTSFLGLLGPNGSGKSTLLKLMLGLIKPDLGSVELGVQRENIRIVPDFPILPERLTINQWIDTLENFYGEYPKNLDFEVDLKLNLNWKLGQLSAGQKRLVSLIPVFFGDPELIILDEPTNFLDIIMRNKVLNLIKDRIQTTNSKVIISSHRIDEMELLASEVVLLSQGRLMSKMSLKFDTRLGYRVRVANLEAFEEYLKSYDVEYEFDSTLMGTSVKFENLGDIMDPLNDYSRDGGVVFSINAISQLQKQLQEI